MRRTGNYQWTPNQDRGYSFYYNSFAHPSNHNQTFGAHATGRTWYPNNSTQQVHPYPPGSHNVPNSKQIHVNWTKGQQGMVQLSKTLAYLLRHGAGKSGFYFKPGGFLYVWELLQHHKPLRGCTLEQILELVRTNDKQRFALKRDNKGEWMIRANQGHSTAVEDLELSPIQDASEVKMVLHGTYYQAWDLIQNTGLSRMTRNHIHFAEGMPGKSGVISGMRKSCQVVIEINLEKALRAGIPFFRSANNVILSPGNNEGIIPHKFFKRVYDSHSGVELKARDSSLPSIQVDTDGQGPQHSMKRMREEPNVDKDNGKRRREDKPRSQIDEKEETIANSATLESQKDHGKKKSRKKTKFEYHTGEEQMEKTRGRHKIQNKKEGELRYGHWEKK